MLTPCWVKKWEEIEREWGKPPRLLVQEWRANSTYRTIARIFEVCEKTLRAWRKAWGLPMDPNDNRCDEFSAIDRRASRKTEKAAKHLDFDSFEDAYRCFKLCDRLVDEEIAEKLGISVRSVVRRKPVELKGLMVRHTLGGRELG